MLETISSIQSYYKEDEQEYNQKKGQTLELKLFTMA